MVRSERSCVFPLRVSGSIAFADRDPPVFAGRGCWALVGFVKPRHNPSRFGPLTNACLIGVRERAVKWVLPRCARYRYVIAPVRRIWVVNTALVSRTAVVPG